MCVIGGVQTLLTLLCVFQMLLGHYGCLLKGATSVVGVVEVLPKNFKMLLGVVGVFCVFSMWFAVLSMFANVTECYLNFVQGVFFKYHHY